VELLKKVQQRLLLIVQFTLVFLFILFEEFIWEGIAEPIYEKIESLHLLQLIEQGINRLNRYVILVLFLVLLLSVEGAGIVAGVLFVQGYILLGLMLYLIKIPIAAFTFWIFSVTKKKLLRFAWFAWSYEKLMAGIGWLKSQEIYQESLEIIAKVRHKLGEIKRRYFAKESRFMVELKAFYKYLKNFKNRKK